MKLHHLILATLLWGLTQLATANEVLTQIEPWSETIDYQRGDLAKYKDVAYIALLPSKNIKPKKISILWRPINLHNTQPPQKGKLYLLGAVVKKDDKQYITKRLNILSNLSDLKNEKKWIAYSGELLVPEEPTDDPIQQLLGEDKNNNGVRDDFEELILNSELSEATKQHALQSAKIFGQTLTLHLIGEELTHAQAHEAMQNLILTEMCRRQHMRKNGNAWRESDYYNNIDRLEASFMSGFYIDDIAGDEPPYDFPDNSCDVLAEIVGAIK